jgi:lipopolysaccharide/colanic/teichoic acid biosynthesis glycosyltransferase
VRKAAEGLTNSFSWAWLQLLCGLLFMLAVSLLARADYGIGVLYNSNFRVTLLAAAVAHVLGYFAYRRFDVFPGMVATGAILPTFIVSYSAVFTTVFLLRLDYSGLLIVVSLAASVSWHFFASLIAQRLFPFCLAVVLGGIANRVIGLPGVSWTVLEAPGVPLSGVQGVVVDLRADLPDSWDRFISDCALAGIPVYHVKQVLESLTGRVEIEHLSENALGSLNPNQAFLLVKQAMDWLSALAGLIVLSPLFLVTAIAIRLDSPGPVIFRQERMGYRGRTFTVFKFRTMSDDAQVDLVDETERAMTRDADARVTRLGAILRRTRIDELPQVINILRGEMSWIGPRPEALPLSRWYEAELPFYRYRHIVRPGITGWAQVNQGHVTALDDVLEKLHYDFYYIKNFSLWLDLVIVVRTLVIVFTGFGAK